MLGCHFHFPSPGGAEAVYVGACVYVWGGRGRGGACSTVMEIVMQEAIGCTDDVFKTLFFLEWICE